MGAPQSQLAHCCTDRQIYYVHNVNLLPVYCLGSTQTNLKSGSTTTNILQGYHCVLCLRHDELAKAGVASLHPIVLVLSAATRFKGFRDATNQSVRKSPVMDYQYTSRLTRKFENMAPSKYIHSVGSRPLVMAPSKYTHSVSSRPLVMVPSN